jgi:hypothetical protein
MVGGREQDESLSKTEISTSVILIWTSAMDLVVMHGQMGEFTTENFIVIGAKDLEHTYGQMGLRTSGNSLRGRDMAKVFTRSWMDLPTAANGKMEGITVSENVGGTTVVAIKENGGKGMRPVMALRQEKMVLSDMPDTGKKIVRYGNWHRK